MKWDVLFKDSVFTYFGLLHDKTRIFCKIQNDSLAKVDYKSIDGDSIRRKFYNEIIPKEARDKSNECKTSGTVGCRFTYRYIESENAMEIIGHYKVTCEFIPKVNKYYSAKYDIKTKILKNTTSSVSP